jgi:hypothetical protein
MRTMKSELIENLETQSELAERLLTRPPVDHVLCNAEFPLRALFYPLGFAVEIATNSQVVFEIAQESWGKFRKRSSAPTLEIRIGVLEGGDSVCPPMPTVRIQRNLVSLIADAHNFAVSDLEQGFGFAWLNNSVIQNRSYLRYHFVEAMPLGLIAGMRATGIHAGCVNFNGQGFLLTGDSGAGKSTLSYACARAGWTYITDDASFLAYDEEDLQVVGNSHQMRFRPSAAELFPELEGLDIAPRAEGKPSVQVPTDEMPGLVTAESSHVDFIIFLNREDPPELPELVPFPREAARRDFTRIFHPLPEIQRREEICIEKLLTAEVYELRYRDLDQAVQLLEALARRDL